VGSLIDRRASSQNPTLPGPPSRHSGTRTSHTASRLPLLPWPALSRSHCAGSTWASSCSAGTWPGPRSVMVSSGSVR
jgi:hypothetical protein